MGRAPCCDKANVKKGPWSPEEDEKLKDYIQTHGTGGNWIALPQKAGLRRCGKSCRLRWLNYLRPNIKHGEFSDDEDKVICALFASIGSRWSIMAAQLPGRTDNDIKNYWNTKLKKKMMMMNSFISMPEITKPLHHLHSNFTSNSTNFSYPSVSNNFHTSSFNDQPLGLGPMESYQGVKDSSSLVMFGTGDQAAASSSSNSDGSCHYDQYGSTTTTVGVYDHNNTGNIRCEFGVNFDKEKDYFGDSSLDSSLEEIKQLISTNLCSSKIDNNLNFFVDETKDVDKVLYYY